MNWIDRVLALAFGIPTRNREWWEVDAHRCEPQPEELRATRWWESER